MDGFAEGKKRRNKLCGKGKGCNGGGMKGVVRYDGRKGARVGATNYRHNERGLNIAVRGAFKAHSMRWCWNRDSRMRGLRVWALLSGVNGVTLPLQLLSPHWNCERRM